MHFPTIAAVLLALPGLVTAAQDAGAAEHVPPRASAGETYAIDNSKHASNHKDAPTLAEVVQETYERYPQRQVFDSRSNEVDALTRQANSPIAGNPALLLLHRSDRLGTQTGLREWEAGVEVPLWRYGQRSAKRSVAETTGTTVASGRDALMLDVAGQVRESVWDVYMSQNSLAQAQREWETAQALQRDVEKRVQLGELAKTDLMLARDETLRKQNLYLAAEAEVAHAMQRYQVLTGFTRVPANQAEEQSKVQSVTNEHPLLAERLAQVRQTQAGVKLARRERADNPQLLVGARRERDITGSDPVDSVGVSLRLPFALESQSAPRIAAAQVKLSESQSQLESERRSLNTALHEAEHHLEVTRKQLALATEQKQLARENLRLAKRAFSLGESDLVSLLRIQSLAFSAERNEQQLNITLKRAIGRYNQAVGVLP
jgi:cobalt-zinc-cadmium efflux system outer membrane protein